MNHIRAPEFPVNPKSVDWDFFFRQFENYLQIVEAKDAQRLPIFLNCLGRDGLLLFDGLPEPKDSYEEVVERFKNHFAGRTSILLKRKQFYEARQSQQETVTNFAVRLRSLAKECDIGGSASILMRDIFVVGIRDDRIGERLLAEDAQTLTFDKALAGDEAIERARCER